MTYDHFSSELSDDTASHRSVVGMMSSCTKVRAADIPTRSEGAGLAKWRLKLVKNYVEQHLSEKVTLGDMASSAGLSRMHFASLFRRATGMRPHDYLLRQRIQAAQHMLQTTKKSIVDISSDVGFQGQAHFTVVFKRFAGYPPARWRAFAELKITAGLENSENGDVWLRVDALGSGGGRLVTDLPKRRESCSGVRCDVSASLGRADQPLVRRPNSVHYARLEAHQLQTIRTA